MSIASPVAADIPGIFDLIIGQVGGTMRGYMFAREVDPNIPFRTQRARYAFTPTFLPRTNVSGKYGDDDQDFFLTASQNDWSLGQGQYFFRANDADKSRLYFAGKGIDTTSYPGRIASRPTILTITPTGTITGVGCPAAVDSTGIGYHLYTQTDAGPTLNLYAVDPAGGTTNEGAHGSGAVNRWGMCNDGVNVYIAGATRITKWTGAAFSSFSATANAGALAFLNNALYSCDGSTLNTYDGTGTKTTLFTWKDATNTARTALANTPKIIPFGGVLLIYFPFLEEGPELWQYDGVGCSRLAQLPDSMCGFDIEVLDGIVFLSGMIYTSLNGSNLGELPVVYYYANGSWGELWRGTNTYPGVVPTRNDSRMPALGNFSGKLIIVNPIDKAVFEYDLAKGALTVVGTWTSSGSVTATTPFVSSQPGSIIFLTDHYNTGGGAKLGFYPNTSIQSGEITSSLIDFDNMLTKTFRGIKVDWEQGGAVDIYYGVDIDPQTGSTTLLQASATSGQEYLLPNNTVGHSICYRLVLNNSGGVPVVKRVYVRAAPQLQSFKVGEFILDCTGNAGKTPVQLRNEMSHPLSGKQQVTNFRADVTSGNLLTVIDRFGSYTAFVALDTMDIVEVAPDEFYVRFTTREV